MEIPPADIGYIAEQLESLAETLVDSWDTEEAGKLPVAPAALCDAIEQLLVVLRGHEQSLREGDDEFLLADKELAELVGYGIQLFAEASGQAAQKSLADTAASLESLSLPLALWGARHGAELAELGPVVNSLARLADQLREPDAMGRLYQAMNTIAQAASPRVTQTDPSDATHPWRVLLLNRAIVATRSHQPHFMEPAFDAVVEWLPDEASRFFAEGMGQMDTIGYPDPVRRVMQAYYLRHAGDRTLH